MPSAVRIEGRGVHCKAFTTAGGGSLRGRDP
jgi:hypothetical protein